MVCEQEIFKLVYSAIETNCNLGNLDGTKITIILSDSGLSS